MIFSCLQSEKWKQLGLEDDEDEWNPNKPKLFPLKGTMMIEARNRDSTGLMDAFLSHPQGSSWNPNIIDQKRLSSPNRAACFGQRHGLDDGECWIKSVFQNNDSRWLIAKTPSSKDRSQESQKDNRICAVTCYWYVRSSGTLRMDPTLPCSCSMHENKKINIWNDCCVEED